MLPQPAFLVERSSPLKGALLKGLHDRQDNGFQMQTELLVWLLSSSGAIGTRHVDQVYRGYILIDIWKDKKNKKEKFSRAKVGDFPAATSLALVHDVGVARNLNTDETLAFGDRSVERVRLANRFPNRFGHV
jgi:hypothetical protein